MNTPKKITLALLTLAPITKQAWCSGTQERNSTHASNSVALTAGAQHSASFPPTQEELEKYSEHPDNFIFGNQDLAYYEQKKRDVLLEYFNKQRTIIVQDPSPKKYINAFDTYLKSAYPNLTRHFIHAAMPPENKRPVSYEDKKQPLVTIEDLETLFLGQGISADTINKADTASSYAQDATAQTIVMYNQKKQEALEKIFALLKNSIVQNPNPAQYVALFETYIQGHEYQYLLALHNILRPKSPLVTTLELRHLFQKHGLLNAPGVK